MTSNPPPAAVDRAVAEAKAWKDAEASELEHELLDTHFRMYDEWIAYGYACGLLAARTNRESAIRECLAIMNRDYERDGMGSYTLDSVSALLTTPEPQ